MKIYADKFIKKDTIITNYPFNHCINKNNPNCGHNINESFYKANCILYMSGNNWIIRSIKDIQSGDELLIYFGDKYYFNDVT